MGILESVKGQFIDVIEYTDENSKTIVKKYIRIKDDDEIKWGAKLIVRESQVAVFVKEGKFTDILGAGTHTLSTDNLPIISKVMSVPYALNSPIKADIYFVSIKQFINQTWGTKNPIIMRDKEFDMIRIRGFGNYSFRIIDVKKFMEEVYGTQRKTETKDIVEYLTSFIVEGFSITMGKSNISILDLPTKYREIGENTRKEANEKAKNIGIEFSNIIIENISLPEEVEKIIDEKSSIGIVKNNFQEYSKYQTVQAMRDAAKQENGLAGLGAGLAFSNEIASNMQNNKIDSLNKVRCQKCNTLNSENAKYCSNCGGKINNERHCVKCDAKLDENAKFCSECGAEC